MEQGYELRLADIRKAVLEHSQNNELYIPLHGKHTTNTEEEPFDLAEKILSFFVFNAASASDPKVMLLMGDTGSGKSVFTQQLHPQLWRAYKAGDPIPLWIPLPELQNPFEGAVEEVLTKYGFNDRQIADIKAKERFIFVVDGYDELHQFQNCYVTNKWETWNTKVLITCRSQALYYQKDPDKYFMPFNGEKRLPMLLRRLYVAPFSKEQISAYLKKYQQLNTEHKISEEDFAKVPGLTELINTPFLLHLAVEALPDILAGQADDQKMTQAKLYDVFIERWFTRQVKKLLEAGLLTDTETNTKQQFWDYCKMLAQQMHEKEMCVVPYQGQKTGGRLFGKQEQSTIWESFFNEETEVLRSACPLKRVGDYHYGFVHASMIEYFATRAMYEEIEENEINVYNPVITSEARQSSEMISLSGSLRFARDDMDRMPQSTSNDRDESPRKNNLPRGGIHQRLFSQEKNSIQFIADRIEMSEAFKQKMLIILEASKKSQHFAIGAANAITALIKAGVTFNCQNLSGIKISGADISGGYFDQADLSNSDLRGTQMRNVWMREANLEGSHVEGINFGEYPGFEFKKDTIVTCFDYREDLQYVVSGSGTKVILWDTVTGEQLNKLQGHSRYVTCIQFSPNGKWIVSGSDDKTIRIWEVATGAEIAVLQGHGGEVTSVALSPNGENLVSGSGDYTVRIWNVVKAEQKHILIWRWRARCVQFSPDGESVVSGSSDDGTIRIWAVGSGKIIALIGNDNLKQDCDNVRFSLDGRRVVSGGGTMIRVWDVASQELIAVLDHEPNVICVAFSPEGNRVVSGSADGTVRVWDTVSQKILFVLRGHEERVRYVQFSHDGKRVISGSDDNSIRIWDVGGEQFLTRVREHKSDILSMQVSQDGRLMASGTDECTVRIMEVMSGKELAVLRGHKETMSSIQFSPDGKWLVSGGQDGIVRLWDVESGRMARELQRHDSSVNCIAFSPNGEWVVSGSGYHLCSEISIRLWEVKSGKELILLQRYEERINSVAFSHDANHVFSSTADSMSVWEVSGRKELALWRCEPRGVALSVSFSSTEDLVAYSQDEYVRVVDMRNGKLIFEISFKDKPLKIYYKGTQFIWDSQHIIIYYIKTIQIWDIVNRQRIIIWKFHDSVKHIAFHNNGSLIVGFRDRSMACWQKTGEKNDVHLELRWSTNIDSPNLFVEGLCASHVIGLNDQNRRLLEQRGGIVAAKQNENSTLQSSALPPSSMERVEPSSGKNQILSGHIKTASPVGDIKAVEKPKKLVSSAELTSGVGQRTSSPVHYKPDLPPHRSVKQEVEEHFKPAADPEILDENERDNDIDNEKKGCHRCVIA